MGKDYILVCDEGTTGLRGVVFNRNMEIVGQHYEKITSFYPGPNEVEQDPQEIWDKQVFALREAVKKAGISPEEIAAVGVTFQRGTHGCWNRKTGKAYHNFLVWQDTRGIRAQSRLLADPEFNKVCEEFPVAKMAVINAAQAMPTVDFVLREEHPDYAAAVDNDPDAVWGGIDTWLLYNMTGKKLHASCASHAGTLPFYSIELGRYSHEVMAYAGIRKEMFPEVLPDVGYYGMMDKEIMGVEIPIMGCIADQQSALFSEGGQEIGSAKVTMGTGTFLDVNIGTEFRTEGTLFPYCAWKIDGVSTYMFEGAVPVAGTSLEWAKTNLQLFNDFGEMDPIALSVEDNAGVYFVPGLSGMDGLPFMNPNGRGSFMGLEARSTKANFVRALLESFAYSTAYLFDDIAKAVRGFHVSEINVDGGVSRSKVVCQTIADLTGARVIRQKADEATAMGAAEMAAIALGWFTQADVKKFIQVDKLYEPAADNTALKKSYEMWKKAVERSKDWVE